MIIDRFEGEYAVLELPDKTFAHVPRGILPLEAKEGDLLCITVDSQGTKERRERIRKKMDQLFEE